MLAADPNAPSMLAHQTQAAGNALVGVGSLWWVLDALWRGLPPWSVVPPILIGLAAVVNAVNGLLQGQHARRAGTPDGRQPPVEIKAR